MKWIFVCLSVWMTMLGTASAQDNWTLPSWVTRTSGTGLYGGFNLPAGESTIQLATLTWKQLNPSPGVYDWRALDALTNGSQPFILRLYNTDVIHCPDWLKTKYPGLYPQRFRWPNSPYPDTLGNTSNGDFYPPWDARFEAEFHSFLMAFKAHGAANSSKFVGWYVPGGWKWNEWSLKWVPEMQAAGVTPQAFLAWFTRLFADYADATNGNPGKLIYTGTPGEEWVEWTGDSTSWNAWVAAINPGDGSNAMSHAAVAAGAGGRDGATEWFNYRTSAPDWGTTHVAATGGTYMWTKDGNPFLAEGRFFGTEIECFGTCGMPAGTADYYHVKMAVLKALQMRMNHIFLGNWNLAPELFKYMLLELGKTPKTAPDAWVALREATDTENGGSTKVQDFSRFLTHREVSPYGLTVKTYPVTSPASQIGTSYEAKRTNRAAGANWMYFDVMDAFMHGGSRPVDIYVTYLDNSHANWRVAYDGVAGPYCPTASVQNVNDGKWKTVKFSIPDAAFSDRQAGGNDFRIYNGGQEDVTVQFVRVVKVNP